MAPPSAIEVNETTDTFAPQFSGPPTVKAIAARRAKAGKLVAGTAAHTSSEFFKGSVSYDSSLCLPFADFPRALASRRRRDGTVGQNLPRSLPRLT